MKSNTDHNQQEMETIQNAKELLLDYYIEIANETNEESLVIKDKENLSLNDIINKIKDSISNIIEALKTKLTSKDTEERTAYESIIQKLESEMRNHYKIESQLKLHNTLLEERLKLLTSKEFQQQETMPIGLSDDSNINNDRHRHRYDEEMLIIKAENSNLKAKLSKYETIIQMGDQKEREIIEEFENEKEVLMKEIAVLETQLSNRKHNKSVYSTSNYNINIGNVYKTNIVSKNNYNGKNRPNNRKEIKKSKEKSQSSRSPNTASLNKLMGKLQPVKEKSTINSKETSDELDLNLNLNTLDRLTTPKGKISKSTTKKSNHLNESLSNKNYFLSTYNKMMNKFSPQKQVANLQNRKLTITSSTIKQKPSLGKKISCSINLKAPNVNQSVNQKNPTINLYNPKKYSINNFMIYKNPKGKEINYQMSSSSREEKKTNHSLRK